MKQVNNEIPLKNQQVRKYKSSISARNMILQKYGKTKDRRKKQKEEVKNE